MIVHAAADAQPDRVACVVYVDCIPAGEGAIVNDELPVANGEVPLPDWSLFDDADLTDLDDGLRAAFRERAIPTPAYVASDPQRLSDERRYDVPITVIACEFPSTMLREGIEHGQAGLRELATIRDVGYVDLPTGHWPQVTRPKELGRAILASVGPA
jgi:pimeloyl-ACP methyl ester carboxylesterase